MTSIELHEYFGDGFVFQYPKEWQKQLVKGLLFVVPSDLRMIVDEGTGIQEADFAIALSVVSCGNQADPAGTPRGRRPLQLLELWRQKPPLPRLKVMSSETLNLHGADGAIRANYAYEIGGTSFRGVATFAERDLLLYKFQLYGTESRMASLGQVCSEIAGSFRLE